MLSSHKSVKLAVTAIAVVTAMMLASAAAQAWTILYIDDDGQGVYLPDRDEPRVLSHFVRFSQDGRPFTTCVQCGSGWLRICVRPSRIRGCWRPRIRQTA